MIVYWNGEYHQNHIPISATSPTLRYGFGFFETLLWDGARICRLQDHLKRIFNSLKIFEMEYVTENFEVIIPRIIKDNALAGKVARINIQYIQEDTGPAQAMVTAAPYSRPEHPLRLALCPRPLHSWLGFHKSTNHLPYYLEHNKALGANLDGTVLASPCGHVLEAAHAALVFDDGQELLTPAPPTQGDNAPGILPSTALAAAREALEINARRIHLNELGNFRHAWALNSLLGMQPVASIGKTQFVIDDETATTARTVIHGS